MYVHRSILGSVSGLWRYAPVAALYSLVVFSLTFSRTAFPGYSAHLVSSAAELIPPSGVAHPLFSILVRHIAAWGVLPLTLRLNLFSVLCGVLCTTLLYFLVGRMILFSGCEDGGGAAPSKLMESSAPILQPEVEAYNRRMFKIAVAGGLMAAFLLTSLAPMWWAATRLENAPFDLLLALTALCVCPLHNSRAKIFRVALMVFLVVLGVFETVTFLFLLPFVVCQLLWLLAKTNRKSLLTKAVMLAGAAGLALSIYACWRNSAAAVTSRSWLGVAASLARSLAYVQWNELKSFFPRSGWLLVLIQLAVPAAVLLFGRDNLLKQRRGNTVTTLCLVVLAGLPTLLNLSIAPFSLLQGHAQLPVLGATLTAAAVALAVAATLVCIGPTEDVGLSVATNVKLKRRIQRVKQFAGGFLPVILVLAFITPLRNFAKVDTRSGAFCDLAAREILASMNGRTWLVTNGYLNNHLLIQADMLKQPLVLVSLRSTESKTDTESLMRQISENPVFAGHNQVRLQNALSISTVRFLMEWFTADEDAGRYAMVLDTPDIWAACGYKAVPEGLAFGGVKADKTPDYASLIEKSDAYVERLLPLLDKREEAISPLSVLRRMLRLKAGMAINELGVLFEDADLAEEAFHAYAQANRVDPLNVSAAINAYELATSKGLHPESRDRLKSKVRGLLANYANKEQALRGAVQYYGTVRQQSFYQQQSAQWLTYGVDAVASDKRGKALALSQQTGAAALVEKASFFFQSGNAEKAKTSYLSALDLDPANKEALAGMCMLMALANDAKMAETWIQRALAAGVDEDTVLYQTIKLALLKGDVADALKQLKSATERFPADFRYWYLRAEMLLRLGDRHTVEFEILPNMQAALKDPNHFVIQTIRGFLLHAKGLNYYKEARQFLFAALSANGALPDVWNMILEIDMALNDLTFMESDARKRLMTDPDHALANYLMGFVLIRRNGLQEAEDFFRRSIESTPTVLACNDLAECLRLQKKLDEAERFARQALVLEPNLLAALDTLACVLCDNGKCSEAVQVAGKTVAARPSYMPYQLTLLRAEAGLGRVQEVRQRVKLLEQAKYAIPPELQKEIAALEELSVKTE